MFILSFLGIHLFNRSGSEPATNTARLSAVVAEHSVISLDASETIVVGVSAMVLTGGVVTADSPATLITLDVVGLHGGTIGP